MDLAIFFGKLQEHEMKLKRLYDNEEDDKKKKFLALKVTKVKHMKSEMKTTKVKVMKT